MYPRRYPTRRTSLLHNNHAQGTASAQANVHFNTGRTRIRCAYQHANHNTLFGAPSPWIPYPEESQQRACSEHPSSIFSRSVKEGMGFRQHFPSSESASFPPDEHASLRHSPTRLPHSSFQPDTNFREAKDGPSGKELLFAWGVPPVVHQEPEPQLAIIASVNSVPPTIGAEEKTKQSWGKGKVLASIFDSDSPERCISTTKQTKLQNHGALLEGSIVFLRHTQSGSRKPSGCLPFSPIEYYNVTLN